MTLSVVTLGKRNLFRKPVTSINAKIKPKTLPTFMDLLGDTSLRVTYTVPKTLPLLLTTAQIVTRTCQSSSLVLTDRRVTHSTNAAERGKKKNLRDRDLSESPKDRECGLTHG